MLRATPPQCPESNSGNEWVTELAKVDWNYREMYLTKLVFSAFIGRGDKANARNQAKALQKHRRGGSCTAHI